MFSNVGDRSHVPVLVLETMQLIFKSKSVMLDECHYCLFFLINVISVDLLAKFDFKFLIKDHFYDIIENNTTIMQG